MSSYISGSGTAGLQQPKPLPKTAFGYAEGNISSSVVLKPPTQVILQGIGNYNFKYDCTTSVGSGLDGGGMSSSIAVQIIDTDNDSLTLPISPCAVSASGNASGTTTNVTFVYRGGL